MSSQKKTSSEVLNSLDEIEPPQVTAGRPPIIPSKNMLATPFQPPVADTSLGEELAVEDGQPAQLSKPRVPSAASLR